MRLGLLSQLQEPSITSSGTEPRAVHQDFWRIELSDLEWELGAGAGGLSSAEAAARRVRFGANTLGERRLSHCFRRDGSSSRSPPRSWSFLFCGRAAIRCAAGRIRCSPPLQWSSSGWPCCCRSRRSRRLARSYQDLVDLPAGDRRGGGVLSAACPDREEPVLSPAATRRRGFRAADAAAFSADRAV